MAITVDTDIANMNPVRNPVLYGVTTDSHISVAELLAGFEATFIGGDMPAAGDSIAVQGPDGAGGWETLYTIDVVTDGTMDGTKNEVDEFTGLVVDDWVEDVLIPVLQLDYTFATHFTFSVASGVLTASGNDINAPQRRLLPTGFAFTSIIDTAPTPAEGTTNFGLLFQLWVENAYNSGSFDLALQEKYDVPTSGSVTFKPHKVLRSYLEPFIPSTTQTTAAVMSSMARHFYIASYEEYGDPVGQYEQTISEQQPAYLAGRNEVARLNDADWLDQLHPAIGSHQFLTTWPNTTKDSAKRIRPEQREFLCYLTTDGVIEVGMSAYNVSTYRLMADLHFTDGTSQTNYEVESVAFVNFGRPLCFAVGVDQRGLDSVQPSKTLAWYRVWVRAVGSGLNERLTEYRYYRVTREHQVNWRQLHYFNSQGGVDTIALVGDRASSVAVDRLISSRYTDEPADMDGLRDVEVSLNTIDEAHQAGTIYLHQDELPALRELFASERIVERVGSEHWPVQVLDDRAQLEDEAQGIRSVGINYRYAFRNTAQSA